MKKHYLFLLIIVLFSCGEDKEVSPDGSIYKIVIEQSGDYQNYNRSLIALTPDINGQILKFNRIETNQTTNNLLENPQLSDPKITLVSQKPSTEIEFNFIISPNPAGAATAGPMAIKFTFYKADKSIGEESFTYIDDFNVKQENLKFK